ncbi:MAG: hypothetical protein FJ087_19700 [Deltaproteobacteria bacterium]|nr:hypothetical protein [Deltaproteobacteria bacterium]
MLRDRTTFGICLAAAFGGALVFEVRAGGLDPSLWTDTVNDHAIVADCLDLDVCPTLGMGTSVAGVRIGVSWVQVLALARAAGLDLPACLLAMHALAALAAALGAAVAARVAGPVAGAATALASVLLTAGADYHRDVVYNSRMTFFLGALFLAALAAVASSRRGRDLVAATVVAAIATEVHALCGLFLVPLAWVAVRSRRRWTDGLLTIIGFATLVFALAPSSWIENVRGVLSSAGTWPGSAGGSAGIGTAEVAGLVATAAAIAAAARERDGTARPILAATAVLLATGLAAYWGARLAGAASASDKYLVPWFVPFAAALAMAAGSLLRIPRADAQAACRRGSGGPIAVAVCLALGAATAAAPVPIRSGRVTTFDTPALTFGDVAAAAESLRRRGWDDDKIARDLKGPEAASAVPAILLLAGPGAPEGPPAGDREAAVLFKVRPERLPGVLPGGFEVLSRDEDGAAVLVREDSRLDWGRFRACTSAPDGGGEECEDSGISRRPEGAFLRAFPKVPGVPADDREERVVTLRIPILPGAAREVRMPTLGGVCRGRIVAAGPPGVATADGERRARIDDGGGTGELVVAWHVRGQGCEVPSWSGFPPFFIEATPETADVLDRMLMQWWR